MKLMSLWRQTAEVRTIFLVLGSAALAWEVIVRIFGVRQILIPAPSVVAYEIYSVAPWLLEQTGYTVLETVLGFSGAVLIGIVLAVLIVSSKLIEKTLYTLLVAFNSIPKAAVAPLFVIWMGTGLEPKIAMALFISIFSIVVNTVQGLRSIDPDMIDLARSLGASRLRIMQKFRLYCALPSLFAGMKVGISLALIGAIVGEFIASSRGLGYVILVAQSEFNTPRIFAAIVILACVGTCLFFLIDLAERTLLPWHISQRRK